jgi:hypothetical protein
VLNIESEFHYAAFKAIALKPIEKIAKPPDHKKQ